MLEVYEITLLVMVNTIGQLVVNLPVLHGINTSPLFWHQFEAAEQKSRFLIQQFITNLTPANADAIASNT